MKKVRIGAVNWDASLPREYYFGFYQINSLSQAKYRTWTPFYADIIDEEKVTYHERTPEEYEREMQYAIDAGIDYFAFVWYPTEGSKKHEQTCYRDCSHKVFELNYARRLYEKSTLKDKLGMCAILAAHPFCDSDIKELTDAFLKPYYEKIGDSPLLYVYSGYREDIISKIIAVCKQNGQPVPYVVPMVANANDADKMHLASALSAYTVCAEGVNTHDELTDFVIEKNRDRLSENLAIIPTFSVGWNPSPRIERTTPWTSKSEGVSNYPTVPYAKRASEEELYLGAVRFSEFLKNEVKDRMVGHVLTFAWNEFEEGGYICPTYTRDGGVSATRVEVFAKISKLFKSSLDGE